MANAAEYNGIKKALFDIYFGHLNPMQKKAVFKTEGPLLVLAGAGSGKTTVIVNRIANVILFGSAASDSALPHNADIILPQMKQALESGSKEQVKEALRLCAVNPAPPYRVLCITFTNKAAREFKERLQRVLGDMARDIWAGTFHSVCVRILRRHIDLLGYKSDFTIYDTDDTKKLITQVLKDLGIAESKLSPKMAMGMISKAKEANLTAEEFALEAGKDRLMLTVSEVYTRYQQRLKAANALDFDDIILLTALLLDKEPEIAEKYRNHFKYILVDEYQDTNVSQGRLVARLTGADKNVCVVGDDDQSIYSFRGATVDNILGFDTEYDGAQVIRLEQNYRSTANILAAANGIIKNNISRKGKELWTEAEDGEKVVIKRLFAQNDEADFICNTIEDAVAKGAKYSDFAVLYRVNALSNALESGFVRKKIPYKIFGGIRFYERREVKDILAYLSVIANPDDDVRLRRIINVPKRAIGDSTIEKAASIAAEQGISLFRVAENAYNYKELSRTVPKLEKFTSMIKDLQDEAKTLSLADLVSRVIEVTGYRLMLAEEENGTEREENILELVSSAALFQETAETPTLAEFLNEISLVSDLDGYEEDTDAVVLMTVHSAKGLEFNTVFLPGFEDGLFPSVQSFSEGESGLEEERRLAYVAVTRARKKLYLLYTSNRMLYGRTENKQLSRFAREIPNGVCLHQNMPSSQSPFAAPQSSQSPKRVYLDNIRAAATKAQAAEVIEEGARVSHPIFGKGEILQTQEMGGDVLYEIQFDNGSIKRLMGSFAKLKRE